MTEETASKHMIKLSEAFRKKSCQSFEQVENCAEKYAVTHGLKFREGEPAIIYEQGSDRAIVISPKPDGKGVHMEFGVSPAFEFLDDFDFINFA